MHCKHVIIDRYVYIQGIKLNYKYIKICGYIIKNKSWIANTQMIMLHGKISNVIRLNDTQKKVLSVYNFLFQETQAMQVLATMRL